MKSKTDSFCSQDFLLLVSFLFCQVIILKYILVDIIKDKGEHVRKEIKQNIQNNSLDIKN